MPDFSWTRQHDLIQHRPTIHPALEAAGYRILGQDAAMRKDQRPRSIAETPDRRARAELIGPEDIIFKATLMLSARAADGMLAPHVGPDLTQFLAILVPAWTEAPAWVEAQLALLDSQQGAEHEFRELAITLKPTGDGKRLILGVTWQPGSAGAQQV